MKVIKERNYKKEYKKFQSGGVQKKRRALRNGLRRKYMKGGKVSIGDGKDIHHYHKGGELRSRVESVKTNRGRMGEGGRIKGKSHNKN